MLRKITLSLVLILALFSQNAQSKSTSNDFVLEKFINYYKAGVDEKLYLQTDKPYYSAGESIWFKGYVLNALTHTPLEFSNFIYVELLHRNGVLVSRVKVRREDGVFSGYINTLPTQVTGEYTLRAYTKWMTNKEDFLFSKDINIVTALTEPDEDETSAEEQTRRERKAAEETAQAAEAAASKKKDYQVQFFAEGGALLGNVTQTVAFKSVAEDGFSIDVTGAVYDSKNEVVAQINTIHKGMGTVSMNAQVGEIYTAKVTSTEGVEKTFELPLVEAQGAVIKVTRAAGNIYYTAVSTSPQLIKGAYVVIHSRGQIIAIDSEISQKTRRISESSLRDGVSVFALVGADNKVISERVVFKKPTSSPTLSVQADAPNYPSRSKVSYTVQVKDSSGAPAVGDFGVSVVDNSSVSFDPEEGDILSYLLLSSDIKGYVEEPGFYFLSNDTRTNYKLDLLMLTQAWRRFDLSTVLSGTLEPKKYNYENSAKINGEVRGFFGNQARRPNIFVLASTVKYMDMFQLDQSSRFSLVDLNIPDSTTYIVQAQGRGGGKSLTLNIEPEVFPTATPGFYERTLALSVPEAFVNQSQQKLFYEGGMGYISIEEVEIEGTRQKQEDESAFSSTRSTTRDDLDTMAGLSVPDILQTYPGLSLSTSGGGETEEEDGGGGGGMRNAYYRGNSAPMRILLDDMDSSIDELSQYTADMVEQINVYDVIDAAMFSNAGGGVIQVILRADADMPSVARPNIAYVNQLGYQRAAKFYVPSYDNPVKKRDPNPDLRTTIYWNGALKSDQNGNITFEFYTADPSTNYTLYIEGVTNDGEICRATNTIKRSISL